MKRTLPLIAFLILLTGCLDSAADERKLERAEERLEEARQEAAEKIAKARRGASEELEKAMDEAEEKLDRAKERLEEAQQRVREAAGDAEEQAERWGNETRREAEDAMEEIGVAQSLGQVLEDVGRALQNEDGVTAVEPRQLRSLLPDDIEGMERYNTDSDESGRWGIKVSHTKAKYRNDRGDKLSLVIADMGTLRGLLSNSEDLLDSSLTHRDGREFSRTTRINGYPARISRDDDDREFDGILVVKDRFVVVMEAQGRFDDDIYEDVFDAIPLRRLARMAQ